MQAVDTCAVAIHRRKGSVDTVGGFRALTENNIEQADGKVQGRT